MRFSITIPMREVTALREELVTNRSTAQTAIRTM